MSDDDFVSNIFTELRGWEESGQRLSSLMEEVHKQIGEAPLCVTDEGEVYIHPDLSQRLHEPDNVGALEYLKYMKRVGIMKYEDPDNS